MNHLIAQACLNLRPEAGVSVDENGIHWSNIGDEIPSDNEINAETNRLIELEISNNYKLLRSAEYPSFADQFDLLYHGGYDAWKNAIQAVKDKYPKPI